MFGPSAPVEAGPSFPAGNSGEPFAGIGVLLHGVITDELLYKRAAGGDLSAFDQLYGRYERRLFSFVLRLLSDRAEAEEVFHDVWVSLLGTQNAHFEGAAFSAWLFRVARNLCANRHRGRARAGLALAKETALHPESETPEDKLLEEERGYQLSLAVERLPAALGDVFRLRTSGLSYQEIAAVLGLPLGTVKSRMNMLTQQLKAKV